MKLLLKNKYVLIIISFIVAIIVYYGVQLGEVRLEEFAAQSLKELALGKDKKGYYVNFKKFNIEWTNSKVEAIGISIIPHLSKDKKSWVNGKVDTLEIELSNLIFGAIAGDVNIENFRLVNPSMQYFWKDSAPKKEKKANPMPKFQTLRTRLSTIGITSINIQNLELNGYYVTNNYKHHHVFHTKQNFILKGLEFNLDTTENVNKIVALKEFRYTCGPTFMKGYGSLYQYKFDTLVISNKRDFFRLKGIELIPQYNEYEFFVKAGIQTDRFTLKIKDIKGNGLIEKELFNEEKYHLESLSIDSLTADIYRDKNFFEDTTKFKSLPHTALRNLDVQVAVDTISLNSSHLTYREKAPKATKAGRIPLSNINGLITNFKNTKDNTIHLDFSFDFLEKANTTLDIDLLLAENAPDFMIAKGHFNAFPLSALNQFTQPNMGVLFQSGTATEIDFNAALNDSIGRGDLDFYYKDLKIKLTGKNDKKSNVFLSIAAFAANNIVYTNNLKNHKPRHSPLYYQRVKYKAVIHFLIHTIMSGAQTAVLGTYGQLPDEEKKIEKQEAKGDKQKEKQDIQENKKQKKKKKKKKK